MKQKLLLLICLAMVCSKQLLAQPDTSVNAKLSMISSWYINDNYMDLPEDSVLRKHFKIEWITKTEYEAKQKTRVNLLIRDTTKFKKSKGVLRLTTGAGTRTFRDKTSDDEDKMEHKYEGQIPALNMFVISVSYWEHMTYNFVSKKDGALISVFSALPILSPDKKKMISIYADPYETDAEITTYTVGKGYKNIVLARFPNWMPGADDLIFWGADGKLYLPFQVTEDFWKEDGNLNTDYRYMRITML
jgi:hypothetical protein